ncbi:MAG: NUDIX hydrolase [Cytophagaceae bacterium]|jgi:8-oxo-dGTP pyrophosphatase MutT (NUDIX family)|nr:NUDIX hydrolase [Cytophagaceae bacterium]
MHSTQEENPWQTQSSKEVYSNPWISLTHREVINPSGGNGIYGVVHFKNKAIGIVPVDEEGYTYLVGQYRYTLNEYSWEIPEGGGPHGEDPLEAAKRELKEETGFEAQQWKLISRIHTSNSVTDEEGFLYLATGLIAGESEPEETEQLRVKKILLKEAVEMVMRDEITDSLSIAALLKAARILKI